MRSRTRHAHGRVPVARASRACATRRSRLWTVPRSRRSPPWRAPACPRRAIRSSAVIAIDLAPSITAWSPFSDTAWRANSALWMMTFERRDAEAGMDRRHAVADIAHVGRAGIARRQVLHREEFAARGLARCFSIGLRHRPVGLEVEIVGLAPADLERGSRWRARRPRSRPARAASARRARARRRRAHRSGRRRAPARCSRARPPSVMMPWMRSVLRMCWRSCAID